MQAQDARPYRSKRNRPCDLCRVRKVCCRIENQPPCTSCPQNNAACTFLQPASKRQKPSTFLHADRPGTQKGELLWNLEESFPDDLVLDDERSPDGLPVLRSDLSVDPMNQGDHLFSPSGIRWDSPLYRIGTDADAIANVPAHTVSWITQDVDADLERSGAEILPNERGALATAGNHSEPSKLPHLGTDTTEGQSLDSINGFSSQLFGLSGESDPYLLRHFHWDENDRRLFIRVYFRKVDSDLNGVPIHFALAKDELAAGLKAEAASLSKPNREILDRLIPPEDGRRMIRL